MNKKETPESKHFQSSEVRAMIKQELNNLKTKNNESESSSTESDIMTMIDLISLLKVSRPTIYNWIEKGLIKVHPVGGRIFFKRSEVMKLFQDDKCNNEELK